jgi:hypothetical protein
MDAGVKQAVVAEMLADAIMEQMQPPDASVLTRVRWAATQAVRQVAARHGRRPMLLPEFTKQLATAMLPTMLDLRGPAWQTPPTRIH